MTTTFWSSTTTEARALPGSPANLRQAAFISLVLMTAAVQFSIAIAQIFLALTFVLWVATLVGEKRRPAAPAWAAALACFIGWTLLSAVFSGEPRASLVDCKQLVLFVIVPITFDLVDASRALPLTTFMLAAGACSAIIGIGQYSVLHYDNLGQRPRSTLGLSLTFSGLMMLVLNIAVARVLFMTRSRIWPAVVMPALAVAMALSFGRNAWVGWCCAVAVLLMMRHLRLVALLPVVAAIFFALAPTPIVQRFYSIFDLHDPSTHDRIAMMQAGRKIIADHPVAGVGPNMIQRVYPQYRVPDAVMQEAPHLHNVPLQIAAERGLPALAFFLWFIIWTGAESVKLFRSMPRESIVRFLSATAIAAIVSMLGAGMFEYNFGDSEFLMLFLVLITLPFAGARGAHGTQRRF